MPWRRLTFQQTFRRLPRSSPHRLRPSTTEKTTCNRVRRREFEGRKTMKIMALGTLAAVLVGTLPAIAKDPEPEYKSVEAKHFPRSEGVELSPAFSDYLYAELRAELTKAKLFGQVIGEDEVVDAEDAPKSLVIVGTITEYKKGSVLKAELFRGGMRSLKVDANVARRSDQQNLTAIHVHVKVSPRWDEKIMARSAAKNIVKQLKNSLKAETKPS